MDDFVSYTATKGGAMVKDRKFEREAGAAAPECYYRGRSRYPCTIHADCDLSGGFRCGDFRLNGVEDRMQCVDKETECGK